MRAYISARDQAHQPQLSAAALDFVALISACGTRADSDRSPLGDFRGTSPTHLASVALVHGQPGFVAGIGSDRLAWRVGYKSRHLVRALKTARSTMVGLSSQRTCEVTISLNDLHALWLSVRLSGIEAHLGVNYETYAPHPL